MIGSLQGGSFNKCLGGVKGSPAKIFSVTFFKLQ